MDVGASTLEGNQVKLRPFQGLKLYFVLFLIVSSSCSTKPIQVDEKSRSDLKNLGDFENSVVIQKESDLPVPTPTPVPTMIPPKKVEKTQNKNKGKTKALNRGMADSNASSLSATLGKKEVQKNKSAKADSPQLDKNEVLPVATPLVRQPELEDTEGFVPGGRRPQLDPFRVGEKVVHEVSYFKVSAGELTLKVDPFVYVNGKKSYSFVTSVESNSVFSSFYSVKDRAETLVDFESMVPTVFTLAVDESGQVRNAKARFDHEKNHAYFFEKKITKKKGLEEKNIDWEILPFSQNVYSASFYMRLFKWDIGKEYAFRVANDKDNIVFKGKALRKEKIKTPAGEFNTIVIKPEFTIRGVFSPVGDIFFWLTDDDRKLIVKIESKIKIGTVVSEAIEVVR